MYQLDGQGSGAEMIKEPTDSFVGELEVLSFPKTGRIYEDLGMEVAEIASIGVGSWEWSQVRPGIIGSSRISS